MVDWLIVVALLQAMIWDEDRFGLRTLALVLIAVGLMLQSHLPAGRREWLVAIGHLLGLSFIALVARSMPASLSGLLFATLTAVLSGSVLGIYTLRHRGPSASLVAICLIALTGLLVRQSEYAHLVVSGMQELQSGPDAVLVEPWVLLVAVMAIRSLALWYPLGDAAKLPLSPPLWRPWSLLVLLAGGGVGLWQFLPLASPFPSLHPPVIASPDGAFVILCALWVFRRAEPPVTPRFDAQNPHTRVIRFMRGHLAWGLALLFGGLVGAALYLFSNEARARCISAENETLRVPFVLVNYLLSAEDPIFFQHRGVDYSRMSAAVREAFRTGELGRGGSTITMQLVKLCITGAEPTVARKIKQIVGAVLLELTSEKEEILFSYLHTVPLGAGARGVSEASLAYFGKVPESLSADESLQLVQTIYDPEAYNPSSAPNKVIRHRAAVIRGRAQGNCKWLKTRVRGSRVIVPVRNSCA
jgi:hypothetical protein